MIDSEWPPRLLELMKHRGGEAFAGDYRLFTLEHAKAIHDSFALAASMFAGMSPQLVCKGKVWGRPASAKWFPFASRNGDEYLVIDRDPGPTGISGQVVYVWQEDERFKWLGEDFESFLVARGFPLK